MASVLYQCESCREWLDKKWCNSCEMEASVGGKPPGYTRHVVMPQAEADEIRGCLIELRDMLYEAKKERDVGTL